MPFLNKTLDVRTGDGIDDVLLEPLVYERNDGTMLRAPVGGTTDGLSVPRCVQNIISATGEEWFSGVLHDSAYRNQLEVLVGVDWVKANYTQEQADDLILEAMISQSVGLIERETIYRALRLFGSSAYADDHAAPIIPPEPSAPDSSYDGAEAS